MPHLVALSGSLRAASINTMLLHAAVDAAPPGTNVEVASIQGIPLYDGDVEAASGSPPAVQALKDRIARADGLLLATPEYNSSIPGVFKNAIDWLSRPWFGGRLMASRAHTLFNAAGELTDETLRKQLREYLQGFAAFVAASAASR